MQSIMLEHISYCSVRSKTYPLLALIGLISLLGAIAATGAGSNAIIIAILSSVAAFFLGLYFLTQQRVLEIASSGGTIWATMSGMKLEEALSWIDAVEMAKNARFFSVREAPPRAATVTVPHAETLPSPGVPSFNGLG